MPAKMRNSRVDGVMAEGNFVESVYKTEQKEVMKHGTFKPPII